MAAKKVVLKLQICCEKDKQKALKKVSSVPGIESLQMDMKEMKLTIIGEVDAVEVVDRLQKQWKPEILTVGPAAKEQEIMKKKEEQKKEEQKKEEGGINKEIDQVAEMLKQYYSRYNYTPLDTYYYYYYYPY